MLILKISLQLDKTFLKHIYVKSCMEVKPRYLENAERNACGVGHYRIKFKFKYFRNEKELEHPERFLEHNEKKTSQFSGIFTTRVHSNGQ